MFINEKITPLDREYYRLDIIESSVNVGVWHPARDWTIDRENCCYLRMVRGGSSGAEPRSSGADIPQVFHFFYNQKLYVLDVLQVLSRSSSQRNENGIFVSRGYVMVMRAKLDGRDVKLSTEDICIIEVLYDAFFEYKGSGIYSGHIQEYHLVLNIEGVEIGHK